jgi:hypothetical protein
MELLTVVISLRLPPALLMMSVILAVVVPAATVCAAQAPQSEKKTPAGKKTSSGASLTGCVDERDGHYILVDDQGLNPMADLEADGFPTEGFAKHMGHKVTVRGTSNSESTRPRFKVRSVETVSETCAPTTQTDKK